MAENWPISYTNVCCIIIFTMWCIMNCDLTHFRMHKIKQLEAFVLIYLFFFLLESVHAKVFNVKVPPFCMRQMMVYIQTMSIPYSLLVIFCMHWYKNLTKSGWTNMIMTATVPCVCAQWNAWLSGVNQSVCVYRRWSETDVSTRSDQ